MSYKDLRGYVGNGANLGAWFDFPADLSTLMKKLTGHEDYGGDLWIEDYEGSLEFHAKGMDLVEFNKVAQAVQEIPEVYLANLKLFFDEGLFEDVHDFIEHWQDYCFAEEIMDRADMGRTYAIENDLTVQEIMDYVDFDSLGKDIESDMTGCFTPNGYFGKL